MQHYYCRKYFYDLTRKYCSEQAVMERLWKELECCYSAPGRYYHTLNHISGVIAVLQTVAGNIDSIDACLFAAFYHDAVYDVLKSDNEERSAQLAAQRLAELNVPAEISRLCNQHILATKTHEQADCADTNLFTDADLAILGAVPPLYREYCANIRKEYSIYPDDAYRLGRKKVLMHFLAMPFIYKTAFFRGRYEQQARENIAAELCDIQ